MHLCNSSSLVRGLKKMNMSAGNGLGMYQAQRSFQVFCFTLKIHVNAAFYCIAYVSI